MYQGPRPGSSATVPQNPAKPAQQESISYPHEVRTAPTSSAPSNTEKDDKSPGLDTAQPEAPNASHYNTARPPKHPKKPQTWSGGTELAQKNENPPQPPAAHDGGASGTGFFVAENGYLVTNAHVVAGGDDIQVKYGDVLLKSKVVKLDEANDVALLKVLDRTEEGGQSGPLPSFAALPVASSSDVKLGDAVSTLGYPLPGVQGLQPKYTQGEINALFGIGDDLRCFQTSVQIQAGSSGSPLVNEKGNVIGILSSKLSDMYTLRATGQLPQNVNYAVKSAYVLALLQSEPGLQEKLPAANGNMQRNKDDIVSELQKSTVLVIVRY